MTGTLRTAVLGGFAAPLLLVATGCVSATYLQNVGSASNLQTGMTLDESAAAMGSAPLRSEVKGPLTEWHYCKTGTAIGSMDDHVALFFRDGRLMETRYYSAERRGDNCTSSIKTGNYRDPDWVAEIRLKS